jgi:hypothetical protein
MTSPTLVSSTVTSITASSSTHTYDLPATVAAGDLLVAWLVAGSSTLTAGATLTADWDQILDEQVIAFHRWQCWVRRADGTEGGTTISATPGSAVKGGAVIQRVSGAWGSGGEGTAYEIASATATGFGTGPNPNPVTAPWGSADQLYLTAATSGGTGATYTAPSGYGSLAQVSSAAGHCVGVASRAETSASDDPAAFTLSTSENHQATTLVIRPLDVSAAGAMTLTAAAAGVSALDGAASGAMTLTAAAAGVAGNLGAASGTISLTGTADGVLTAGAAGAMTVSAAVASGFARTRGLEWVAAGERALLDGSWSTTTDCTLRLFTNDPSATITEAAANQLDEDDFTEADFVGYAAASITSAGWTVTEGDPTDATHATVSFATTTDITAVDIVGYYLTRDSDGAAMGFEVFTNGPYTLEADGDTLSFDPKVTLQ